MDGLRKAKYFNPLPLTQSCLLKHQTHWNPRLRTKYTNKTPHHQSEYIKMWYPISKALWQLLKHSNCTKKSQSIMLRCILSHNLCMKPLKGWEPRRQRHMIVCIMMIMLLSSVEVRISSI